MSKETIPQSIIDKIEHWTRTAPMFLPKTFEDLILYQKQAAEFGYGLSEERIKELECKVEDLNKCLNKALKF